jgi:hypothetical protein
MRWKIVPANRAVNNQGDFFDRTVMRSRSHAAASAPLE